MLNKLAYRILSRKKFLMKFLLPTNNPYVEGVSFTNDRHKEKKKTSPIFILRILNVFSNTLAS